MSYHLNMVAATKILEDALHLPEVDRSYLASKLIESLDEDDGLSPEQMAEARRRAAALDAGETFTVSHEEAMASARAAVAKVREERNP